MGDVFHSWRRKLGFVTLATALIVAVGWVRSLLVTDSLHLLSRRSLTTFLPKQIYSADQSLIIVIRADPNDDPPGTPWVRTDRFVKNPEWITTEEVVWQIQCCSFAVGMEKPDGPIFLIPYWSIEISLTLISAYTLLVKSELRKRDENQNHLIQDLVVGNSECCESD